MSGEALGCADTPGLGNSIFIVWTGLIYLTCRTVAPTHRGLGTDGKVTCSQLSTSRQNVGRLLLQHLRDWSRHGHVTPLEEGGPPGAEYQT